MVKPSVYRAAGDTDHCSHRRISFARCDDFTVGHYLSAIGLRDAPEVELTIASFGRDPNGGLTITASGFGANPAEWIAALAGGIIYPRIIRSGKNRTRASQADGGVGRQRAGVTASPTGLRMRSTGD
jgi:hypothetical protein